MTAFEQSNAIATAAAKPALTGPKRQHFLPRFYLEGFCKDGMVAVYDGDSDELRLQQPVNTGVIGHFYTFEDSEGRKRFDLEQMLSEFESKASPATLKLAAGDEPSDEERSDLAIFVALAGFRTPDIVESLKLSSSRLIGDIAKSMFASVEQVKETLRGKSGALCSEDELEQNAREMVEFAQSGNYTVTTSHRWAVGTAIMMAFHVAPLLAGRNWLVAHRHSEKKSFVTSDAPVLLGTARPRERSIWGVGFGNADAVVGFPLTQACALIMSGNEGILQHREVGSEAIRQLNLGVAGKCQRYVIGRDEVLVRSLTNRLNLSDKKWQPKMQWT